MTAVVRFVARTIGLAYVTMIDLEPDEFGRELAGTGAASLGPAILDHKVATAIQPSSCSRCVKAPTHWPWAADVPDPKKPMVCGFGC